MPGGGVWRLGEANPLVDKLTSWPGGKGGSATEPRGDERLGGTGETGSKGNRGPDDWRGRFSFSSSGWRPSGFGCGSSGIGIGYGYSGVGIERQHSRVAGGGELGRVEHPCSTVGAEIADATQWRPYPAAKLIPTANGVRHVQNARRSLTPSRGGRPRMASPTRYRDSVLRWQVAALGGGWPQVGASILARPLGPRSRTPRSGAPTPLRS